MDLPRFRGRSDAERSERRLAPPLIVHWAEAVEGRVTSTRVVPGLEVVEDLRPRLVTRAEPFAVDELALQGREEALGHRVIETVADAAHRRSDAGLLAASAEDEAGVLAAVVRMLAGRTDEGAVLRLAEGVISRGAPRGGSTWSATLREILSRRSASASAAWTVAWMWWTLCGERPSASLRAYRLSRSLAAIVASGMRPIAGSTWLRMRSSCLRQGRLGVDRPHAQFSLGS